MSLLEGKHAPDNPIIQFRSRELAKRLAAARLPGESLGQTAARELRAYYALLAIMTRDGLLRKQTEKQTKDSAI